MKWLEVMIYHIIGNSFLRFLVIVATLIALILSLLMFPTKLVLAKMLPGKSANTFSIYIDTPTNSSYKQTKTVVECVTKYLRKEKEIIDIEAFLGMGSPLDYAGLVKGSTFKEGENVAEVVVNLTDKHHRKEPSFLIVERLRPILKENCEPIVDKTTIKLIEQPAGPPTLASIVVEVYGEDLNKIRDIANKVSKILKSTKGLVDIDILEDDIYKKFELKIDKDKVAKSGISIEQLHNILYLGFEGMIVGVKNSQTNPDQIGLFLTLSKDTKRLSSYTKKALMYKLSSLRLMNKKGMMVPVSELVKIKEVYNQPSIMSKDLENMINVIAETDMVSQVYPLLDAREKMIKYFSLHGYRVKKEPGFSTYMFDLHLKDKLGNEFLLRWDGEMKVTLDTFRDLGGAFIAALILIFLLLVIYYKSFALSGIILGGSFLSIIGVIIGHYIADLFTEHTFFLTATSLIGFIALMGISSRNSLLLIDFTKALIQKGMDKQKAISIATATRAKPIFLTAVAIILGSALLATDPIFGGLGVALISGTVVAVIVSLIFVPVLMYNTKAL